MKCVQAKFSDEDYKRLLVHYERTEAGYLIDKRDNPGLYIPDIEDFDRYIGSMVMITVKRQEDDVIEFITKSVQSKIGG